MTICFDTRSIHPHMAPLGASLRHLVGDGCFRYFYRSTPNDPFRASGAKGLVDDVAEFVSETVDASKLSDYDVILENHRDFDLIEDCLDQGKVVFYQSERWFKPISSLGFSGFLRMFFPFGIRRALRIKKLFSNPRFIYLPLGVHAARDMARLCGLLNGDLRCLFRAPRVRFEREPGGRIYAENGRNTRYNLEKMRMWAYFVSATRSMSPCAKCYSNSRRKILWVGRMLRLKRIDDILKAIRLLRTDDKQHENNSISLTLVGDGEDKPRLMRMVKGLGLSQNVEFKPSMPSSAIRELMRTHDIYVFSSNQHEGWGAVVNESLVEGMNVIGTYESGASSVLLPESCLYHAGDVVRLSQLLKTNIKSSGIGQWTPENAAQALVKIAEGVKRDVE